MAKGGKREGAGRKRLSKEETLLASLCRDHTKPAISKLVKLMDSENETVVLGAIKEIFDRGWGKAPQALTGESGSGPVEVVFGWMKSE